MIKLFAHCGAEASLVDIVLTMSDCKSMKTVISREFLKNNTEKQKYFNYSEELNMISLTR